MTCRKRHEPIALGKEERIGIYEKRARSLLDELSKGRLKVCFGSGRGDKKFPTSRDCRRRHVPQRDLRIRIIRIQENGDRCSGGR